jgi:2-deoxy-D-gluconate 3-dehydrogenase
MSGAMAAMLTREPPAMRFPQPAGRHSISLVIWRTRRHAPRFLKKRLRNLVRIDILVNNAGTIHRAPAAEYPMESWDELIAMDLTAVFRLSQLAGGHMLQRGTGGKTVNIASVLSFQAGVFVPAYAVAKNGIAQLTKALANECASKGINVNAIAPGYMATDNNTALRADPARSRQLLERIPAAR